MYRFIALGLAALALISSAAVRAEESSSAAPAAEAAPSASAAQVAVAASAPAKPTQHCYKEYRVGSNMPVTHCETAEDNNAQSQANVRAIQNEITREAGANARAPGGR